MPKDSRIISEELLNLGITPNLTGFRYSEFIIQKILDSGNKPLSMSALLNSCSIKNECTANRVEKSLGSVATIVKNNGHRSYFGGVTKITPAAFVFTIAERIRNKKEG